MQRARHVLLVGIVLAVTIGGALSAEPPKEVTNSIGMKFVLIPAGEFLMGSPELPEEQAKTLPRWTIEELKCEQPQHTVRITKPFYLSVTEVTQEQYTTVLGARDWRLLSRMMPGADEIRGELWEKHDYPAFDIRWDEAVEFCRKLSAKEGRTYRLPTEAEWEYACRATTTTKWCCGDEKASLGHYAWYYRGADRTLPSSSMFPDASIENEVNVPMDDEADPNTGPHSVAQKKPNRWGLYDMHGNVAEWCNDWFGEDYYASLPLENPAGPTRGSIWEHPKKGRSGPFRVCRGGSWDSSAEDCRSASRDGGRSAGLRVVLESPPGGR
jgi:formylglycine-generating enzyme required for sulfatase activity